MIQLHCGRPKMRRESIGVDHYIRCLEAVRAGVNVPVNKEQI